MLCFIQQVFFLLYWVLERICASDASAAVEQNEGTAQVLQGSSWCLSEPSKKPDHWNYLAQLWWVHKGPRRKLYIHIYVCGIWAGWELGCCTLESLVLWAQRSEQNRSIHSAGEFITLSLILILVRFGSFLHKECSRGLCLPKGQRAVKAQRVSDVGVREGGPLAQSYISRIYPTAKSFPSKYLKPTRWFQRNLGMLRKWWVWPLDQWLQQADIHNHREAPWTDSNLEEIYDIRTGLFLEKASPSALGKSTLSRIWHFLICGELWP